MNGNWQLLEALWYVYSVQCTLYIVHNCIDGIYGTAVIQPL